MDSKHKSTKSTNSNGKSTQAKTPRVLYYSVNFSDYDGVVQLVKKVLTNYYDEQGLDSKFASDGFYTKTVDSYEYYGKDDSRKIDDDQRLELSEKFGEYIEKMKTGDNFLVYFNRLYQINGEFHITTLYTGGKPHEKSSLMDSQSGKKVLVQVYRLGVSDDFLTLGVSEIKFESGEDIEYYGNDVKHITFALSKSTKKVLPKDSYTALETGTHLDVKHQLQGMTHTVC
jgi:hypothetical protein